MKKPRVGRERPGAFVVELGASWRSWAKGLSDAELEQINVRLTQLVQTLGHPHLHAGLGLRRLQGNLFEFRASSAKRVMFLFIKPNRIRLMMAGNHDEVRAWLKATA